MAPNCCVPKCSEKGGYVFPKEKELKKKWRVAIKRANDQKQLWNPSKHSVVCRKHFKSSDFVEPKVTYGEKRRKVLKAGVVPSIFPFRREPSSPSDRSKRYELRNEADTRGLEKPGKIGFLGGKSEVKATLYFSALVFIIKCVD